MWSLGSYSTALGEPGELVAPRASGTICDLKLNKEKAP